MLVLDAPPSPDNDPASWIVSARRAGRCRRGHRATRGDRRDAWPSASTSELRRRITGRGLDSAARAQRRAGGAGRLRHRRAGSRCDPDACRRHATRRNHGSSTKRRRRTGSPRSASRFRPAPSLRPADVETARPRSVIPITLKALGLAHKSESGAVKVGLADDGRVAAALAAMPRRRRATSSKPTVTDVVAEVLVAVRRDPPVGWLVIARLRWRDDRGVERRRRTCSHRSRPTTFAPRSGEAAELPAARPASAVGTGCRHRRARHRWWSTLTDAVVGTDVVEVELNPVLGRSARRRRRRRALVRGDQSK